MLYAVTLSIAFSLLVQGLDYPFITQTEGLVRICLNHSENTNTHSYVIWRGTLVEVTCLQVTSRAYRAPRIFQVLFYSATHKTTLKNVNNIEAV